MSWITFSSHSICASFKHQETGNARESLHIPIFSKKIIFQKCKIAHYYCHGKICPTLILVWWCLMSLIISNNFLDQHLSSKWTPKSQSPTASHFPNIHRTCYQELKYWLSYLSPFQAHVAYFEARGSCYSTSTTGNPQRKSSTVRFRWTPAGWWGGTKWAENKQIGLCAWVTCL